MPLCPGMPHTVSYPKKMAKIKIALWVQQILSFNFLLLKRYAQKFRSDTLVSHSSSALNFSTHIYPSSPFFQEIWYSQDVNYLLEVIYNFMKKKDNFSFTVPKILCQQKLTRNTWNHQPGMLITDVLTVFRDKMRHLWCMSRQGKIKTEYALFYST